MKTRWGLVAVLLVSLTGAGETVSLRWHLGSPRRGTVRLASVDLPVNDGECRFVLPKEKIPADAWALDVMPTFMTARVGEDGWWMNGRGVYGRFSRTAGMNRWWRSQTPIFALKRGETLWRGRMNTYRFDYDLVVEARDGRYALFPRIRFDRVREYFPPYADLDVSYRRYDGEQASYAAVAKEYRAAQFAAGVKPIRERVKTYPDLAYLSEAMVIRLQTHGAKSIPEKPTDFTLTNEPPINVYLPFSAAADFVTQVKAAGVHEAAFVSAGWNRGGYDGRLPEHFPVEPVFGGEKGLRQLIARSQELGFMMMLHATMTEVYTVCPWFREDYIAKKTDGSRAWNGLYFGGSCYWICERASWEGWVAEEMRRMRDLGVKGNHYVDVFSATYPNRCADPRHPATPERMAAYQNRILAEAKTVFGGVSSEGGYDHVAANLDCINYVSVEMKKLFDGKTEGLELVDGVFPFWEIVYHGSILYNSDRFTQNHTRGQNHAKKDESGNLDWLEGDGIVDPRTSLKIAEFGGRPIFYTYKLKDIPAIKRAYDEFQPLKHLQTVLIDDHREVARELFVTRYENGEEVVSNYAERPRTYRGRTVPAFGYVILRP